MKRPLSYLLMFVGVFVAVVVAIRVDGWILDRFFSDPAPALDKLEVLEPDATQVQFTAPAGAPADFRSAVKRVLPAVVSVDRFERYRDLFADEVRVAETGTGSGVVISEKGYILTNNHVVQGADAVRVRLSDERGFEAQVVGTDPRSDLALLKIEAASLKPALLGDSAKLEVGEWVIAVGNPFGYASTVSAGVVSNLNRAVETGGQGILLDTIQTDAAINQGNSGGALANAKGEVVGINTAIISNSGGSIGLGFAIPIARAQRVVSDILKFGRVRYGDIGVEIFRRPGILSYEPARAEIRLATGSEPPERGLLVRRLAQNSAASRAGIRALDVLVAVDDVPIEEPRDLAKALIDRRVGDKVRLKYWSRGSVKTANLVLEEL